MGFPVSDSISDSGIFQPRFGRDDLDFSWENPWDFLGKMVIFHGISMGFYGDFNGINGNLPGLVNIQQKRWTITIRNSGFSHEKW